MSSVEVLLRLAVALAIGLLIGLERERSHRAVGRQAIGARTIALLSAGGAVAAAVGPELVAAGALAAGLLAAVAYWQTSALDPGATTEVAALVAYLLGALAWDRPQPAVAAAVAAAVLLASKTRVHYFAREVVTEAEVQDALKFFVITFVVLPLLPNRNLGPYAVLNPARIWFLVVAVTGIGWVGYVATRAWGADRGLPLAGFAGGFVSGSATTGSMGRRTRSDPAARRGALGGALLASVATLIQLGVITTVASSALLRRLLPALVLGSLILVAETYVITRRPRDPLPESRPRAPAGEQVTGPTRAFALRPALILAAVLTTVLLVARWGQATFGAAGAVITAGLAGFADVHAAVLTVATLTATSTIDLSTAVLATGLALATNTTVKCILATTGGGRGFGARFTLLLLVPVAAVATTLTLNLSL